MSARRAALLAALACAAAVPAAAGDPAAAPLPRPAVEYQAELRYESGRLALAGAVHYTPDRERRTLALEGAQRPAQPIIIRRDQNVVWVLDPQRKSYYGRPLGAAASPGDAFAGRSLTERVEVGRETIEGRTATKYRVRFAELDGNGLAGHIWVSGENILLRVEATAVDGKANRSRPVRMTLTNLKLAPQDPQLFEVPKDFTLAPPGRPAK